MNLADYNPRTGEITPISQTPGMTPDDVRELTLVAQLDAMVAGESFDAVLVAWEDQPSDYFSVFFLGDCQRTGLTDSELDRIKAETKGY